MNSDFLQLAKLKSRFRAHFAEFYAKLPALMKLIRLDKPIGVYLLLWPTISALWIAAEGFPDFHLLVIFMIGTFLMRSAGCCVNDFADHKFDGKVARTRTRPLASGALTRRDAVYTFAFFSLAGFTLVLFTNTETILLSLGAIAIVIIYPFMKRFTHLPQLILGITFSWGMLMAFTAQRGEIPAPGYLLFIANILWTVAYDTQYAMVDRDDDLEIGIRSTAILFGSADRFMIGILQGMFVIALWLAGRQFQLGSFFIYSLLVIIALMVYQQYLIKDRTPSHCFKAFLNNNWVGAVLFMGVFLSYL
jgi:4-hydroxybenzoate polyprenyltransferase